MPEPSDAPPAGPAAQRPREEEPDTEDVAPGSPVAPPPTNLAKLRQQYAESGEDRRETIPIAPGRFDGNLAARYHPVEWSDTRKRIRKAAKRGLSEETELNYAAGQLVKACETILIRLEDGGEFVPLHEAVPRWKDGPPVRYDSRLAEAIGIDVPAGASPASICRLVFKNPHALNDHYVTFDQWLREATEGDEDDEDEDGSLEDRPT